jgi:hypothetical protein
MPIVQLSQIDINFRKDLKEISLKQIFSRQTNTKRERFSQFYRVFNW